MYSTIFNHLESYEINAKRNLKGINSATGEPYPLWLKSAAAKAKNKLEKYYASADSSPYLIGTGKQFYDICLILHSIYETKV